MASDVSFPSFLGQNTHKSIPGVSQWRFGLWCDLRHYQFPVFVTIPVMRMSRYDYPNGQYQPSLIEPRMLLDGHLLTVAAAAARAAQHSNHSSPHHHHAADKVRVHQCSDNDEKPRETTLLFPCFHCKAKKVRPAESLRSGSGSPSLVAPNENVRLFYCFWYHLSLQIKCNRGFPCQR